MSFDAFSENFIERTQKIVERYRELFSTEIANDKGFEITLLLNCVMGLVVYPKDSYFNRMNKEGRSQLINVLDEVKGVTIIDKTTDEKTKESTPVNFKEGVLAIRNTFAHMGDCREQYKDCIKLNGSNITKINKFGKIKKIEIVCIENRENKDINFTISINLEDNELAFDEFIIELCSKIRGNVC